MEQTPKKYEEQHHMKLQKQFSQTLEQRNDHFIVSSYTGELTPINVTENMKKILIAFPTLKKEYFDLLMKLVKEKGFSDERLNDAVIHVICTCIYPQPTIANFLSYDMPIKIYNYMQIVTKVNQGESMGSYTAIDINKGKPFYALNEDVEKYNLKIWQKT